MYKHQEERSVEPICYKHEHIAKVLITINANFLKYFDDFIMLEAGHKASEQAIIKMAEKLGTLNVKSKKNINYSQKFKNVLIEALDEFERDRDKYLAIFDKEALEEYKDDPQYFKSTVLKNECPIIHSTIHNKKAKELDKYRYEFSVSKPQDLLSVVSKLHCFANNYHNYNYDLETYDYISSYEDLKFSVLDTEEYTVYGVIGGGIKSQMLYKIFPSVFPNRSRDSIWALWYLTEKKTFDCKRDSEFLMIDVKESITQQNYFYPYELFTFYAHQIFQMIRKKANENNVYINPETRYVIVDAFLGFIAKQHNDEISVLRQQIKEGGFEYA